MCTRRILQIMCSRALKAMLPWIRTRNFLYNRKQTVLRRLLKRKVIFFLILFLTIKFPKILVLRVIVGTLNNYSCGSCVRPLNDKLNRKWIFIHLNFLAQDYLIGFWAVSENDNHSTVHLNLCVSFLIISTQTLSWTGCAFFCWR